MSGPGADGPGTGSAWPEVALVAALGLFAAVGNLVLPLAELVGVGGAVVSVYWRRRSSGRPSVRPFVPVLVALAVLGVTSPPSTAAEVLGGLGAVAFLLWAADDPSREPGAHRRAMPAIALSAVAVVLALSVTLLGAPFTSNVGVAGGLLALGVGVLAVLLARLGSAGAGPRPAPDRTVPPT